MMGWQRILPELILVIAGVVVMLGEGFLKAGRSRFILAAVAAIASLVAMGASVWQLHEPAGTAYWNAIRTDAFSAYYHVLLSAILLCTVLVTAEYLNDRPGAGEMYALLLFGTTGMMLMTSAASLLLVFIGLEISSISSYVMTGFRKHTATGPEAALKYFLLGSFATAFFLYGVALAFGATGSDSIYTIGQVLATISVPTIAYVSLALMLIGLGFKVSAAPFQVWTPDVYEGAPTPITGFMSTGPKAATFAVLLRILWVAFPAIQPRWSIVIWVLAVASMTVGNLGALVQTSVKRMLAYSSIAHAGYILAAVAVGSQDGASAVIFYLAGYAAMNLGAFAALSYLGGYEERGGTLEDMAGLARRAPFLAAVFTLFLFSLIGIPFTGGFFGKFYVFAAALHGGYIWLTIIGLLNSGIAAFYYLRVVAAMYMRPEPEGERMKLRPMGFGTATVLVFAAAATLVLGILPGHVLEASQAGAAALAASASPVVTPQSTQQIVQPVTETAAPQQ
jgi:NADH-quinone oxidoreductase subunit N